MAAAKRSARHWLVKSEPDTYSWQQLVRDKKTRWDGVRNFEARNNLREMRAGDLVLFYHSGSGKEIVGVARVLREAYADPTAESGDWSVVDLEPVQPLAEPVGLARMKSEAKLREFALIKRGRLSVVPVQPQEFAHVLKLGATRL